MRKRLLQALGAAAVLLIAAQFIRPDLANPATDPGRTIRAHPGITSNLADVLDRSCGDCHSNSTVWPWYAGIAPFSWFAAHGVSAGRRAVNFSDWAGYSPGEQRKHLTESCQDVRSGKMPGAYTALRPETRLTSQEIDLICGAARKAEADASHAG